MKAWGGETFHLLQKSMTDLTNMSVSCDVPKVNDKSQQFIGTSGRKMTTLNEHKELQGEGIPACEMDVVGAVRLHITH